MDVTKAVNCCWWTRLVLNRAWNAKVIEVLLRIGQANGRLNEEKEEEEEKEKKVEEEGGRELWKMEADCSVWLDN